MVKKGTNDGVETIWTVGAGIGVVELLSPRESNFSMKPVGVNLKTRLSSRQTIGQNISRLET